jgi:hypothetical protein
MICAHGTGLNSAPRQVFRLVDIELSLETRGGIRPEAEAFLSRYRPERFHHLRLRRRPPAGAYAISIAQVWPPFMAVLDLFDAALAAQPFEDPGNVRWETPLIESTERLLYAIQEHLEDCDHTQRAKAALDPLPGHYLTIQTSFERSLSFASLARASASEENFTRTLNVAPDRSTNVDMNPWSIAFAASASAVF